MNWCRHAVFLVPDMHLFDNKHTAFQVKSECGRFSPRVSMDELELLDG